MEINMELSRTRQEMNKQLAVYSCSYTGNHWIILFNYSLQIKNSLRTFKKFNTDFPQNRRLVILFSVS